MRLTRWPIVCFINLVLLLVGLGAIELAARHAFPCAHAPAIVPWSFVAGVGAKYAPHALLRETNGFDFCVEQETNSQGFLDAEPPPFDSIRDKPRIVLVGDSMAEAAQVALKEKSQTLLRASLAAAGVDAHVSSVAVTGYGQVQELALFKHYGLPLHPSVVVLVIVYNDLKNNSWLLQALQDGTSPDTPYNVQIRPTANGWEEIAPRPTDKVQQLPLPSDPGLPSWAAWLKDRSTLYGYALHLASWNYPRTERWLSGKAPFDPLPARVAYLARDPDLAPLLVNWPANLDVNHIDWVFERQPGPLAAALAVQASEHVMDQWVALSQAEGFKLVALMHSDFEYLVPGQGAIWRRILAERNIPALWQGEFMKQRGYRQTDAHFLRDGHWNAQGHRWAADQLADFLLGHKETYLTPGN